jgi:hypothetical protein
MYTYKQYSMEDVKRMHSGYFFSAGALYFFGSKINPSTYTSKDGARVYFVTSEQFDEKSPRRYTVRYLDVATGKIQDGSNFQEYASRTTAHRHAARMAREIPHG